MDLKFNFHEKPAVTIDRNKLIAEIAEKATDEELDVIARLLKTTKLRGKAIEAARKRLKNAK